MISGRNLFPPKKAFGRKSTENMIGRKIVRLNNCFSKKFQPKTFRWKILFGRKHFRPKHFSAGKLFDQKQFCQKSVRMKSFSADLFVARIFFSAEKCLAEFVFHRTRFLPKKDSAEEVSGRKPFRPKKNGPSIFRKILHLRLSPSVSPKAEAMSLKGGPGEREPPPVHLNVGRRVSNFPPITMPCLMNFA